MNRLGIDLSSLPAQMILSIIGLVLLTAVAAGLPAFWLIRNQLERQSWAQVEQGSRAAQALYAASQSEMSGLATLTAQRPTLLSLLAQRDRASMLAYLRTLQAGAGLDLVLICDAYQQVVTLVGEVPSSAPCSAEGGSGFHVISAATGPQVWLLASKSIGGHGTNLQGTVIVGLVLDAEFARQMRDQTGLEHTLLMGGQGLATSLDRGVTCIKLARRGAADGELRATFDCDDGAYYAIQFPLSPTWPSQVGSGSDLRGSGASPTSLDGQLRAEVALSVSGMVAAKRGVAWTLAGGIALVAALGSLTGALLARRISGPLARLTQAAIGLSRGDLDSSMAVEARVREVALVAETLENARIDLQRSLTELQEEKAWTDHLLEAIVEGIVTLDQLGRITFFSPGAERITGWDRDAVLNRACDEVFRTLESDEPFSQLIPPPGRRNKISLELANGHQATLAVTGAQLMPPETDDARVALVFRDVSEEEAVHRLMGHFLANVAHEFRTPLSALAASVELLLDQSPELSATELQELLISLHLGILGLQTLVDNLLESASIEAGRFRVFPRPSNLARIIAEAIRIMQPLLDKYSQRLVLELPAAIPVVRADWRRTGQVLVNLLSNASKYGPEDAEITVIVCLNEGWVRITVADRGPGIPPEYRNGVFRRFEYPTTSTDKAKYGVGLGLSVVKAIVEAHGGKVGVDDRPGGGSAFWFTLPVESES